MSERKPESPSDSPERPIHAGRAIGRKIGGLVGGAVDAAVGAVETVGRTMFGGAMRMPGLGRPERGHARPKPGSRPGIEYAVNVDQMPPPDAVYVTCIDYSIDRVVKRSVALDDLAAFLAEPQPSWATVRWINVDGLHPWVINQFRIAYNLHTLAAEDVQNVPQRPKVEAYGHELFVIARMLSLTPTGLMAEQTSYFLSEHRLISFQETHGDVWDPVRQRIETEGSRLRQCEAGYLFYALLDSVVDTCFPILERYGDMLEELELDALDSPKPSVLHRIHGIKRQLVTMRRIMWPMREVVDFTVRDESAPFTDYTRTYLRDVYDHAIQVIDIIETYREMAGGLTDLYMSAVSNRMNEVMKVLTIMATLFIPVTFVAGVFGMNFKHFPETEWHWMYPWGFWLLCGGMIGGMLLYFRRRGWLGG